MWWALFVHFESRFTQQNIKTFSGSNVGNKLLDRQKVVILQEKISKSLPKYIKSA